MSKNTGYILARIAGLLVVLLMAALLAIQTPYVQTRLSKVALNQLAAIMDGRIQYDELKITTSGVAVIRNITLVDGSPYSKDIHGRGWAPVDTVFKARLITATFSLGGLFKGEGLHLGRVTVEDAFFHLVSEPEAPGTNLGRIFNLPVQTGPLEPGGPDVFDIQKLRVKNVRFCLTSFLEQKAAPPTGDTPQIYFDDLDITADVTGHNMRFSGGKMRAFCDHLSAREKSGYIINDLSGSCDVGLGQALVEDIHILDPWSDVRVHHYKMTYPWAIAFKNFLEEVRLDAELQPSSLALQTLSYFTGAFGGTSTVLDIEGGRMDGYISNFRIDKLRFTEAGSGVGAIVDGSCSGLPDVNRMMLDARVQDLTATTGELSTLIAGIVPHANIDFSRYFRDVPMTLQLSARGPLDQLEFSGELASDKGDADFEGDLRHLLDKRRSIEIGARLGLRDLDLGRVLATDALGPVTLRTRARAVLRPGFPEATLDSLRIDRLQALGRDFHGIEASGTLIDGTAEGELRSVDPAARFALTALADLQPQEGGSRYRLDGELSELDLTVLGIKGDSPLSRISTNVQADVTRMGSFFKGEANLLNFNLIEDNGPHPVGDILLGARIDDEDQVFNLEAPFLEANYTGNHPVDAFIRDLQDLTVRRDLPSLVPGQSAAEEAGRYSLGMLFHNTRDILSLLLPGAYIADNTSLHLVVDEDGDLSGGILSDRLAYGKNFLKDVNFQFDNLGEGLFAELLSSELRAGTFAMNNPAISVGADDDSLRVALQYDSFSGGGGNAELKLDGRISRDSLGVLVVRAHPQESFLTTGDDTWTIGESDIVLHGKDFHFDHFQLSNGDQRLLVDGGLSETVSDTLSLRMDRFDLALIDEFLPVRLGIQGNMDGLAYLTSSPEDKNPGMLMDLQIDSLRLSGADAGSIRLSSNWNDEGKELGLFLLDHLDGRDVLSASGSYFVADKSLDVRADLDYLPLAVAAPFLTQIFSEMGGGISGKIRLAGPGGGLSPSSEDLRLQNALLRIAPTGVPYTVQGPLRIEPSGCFLDELEIRDDTGGTGRIQGSIRYDNLQNFNLDSRLDFNRLKVIDAAEKPGSPFYGLVRASGSASVTGPFSSLLIDANVNTAGEGDIHIPLSGSLSSSSSNLLTFTEPVRVLDPYEQMLAEMETKSANSSDIRIRGHLGIQPGLKAFVEIDKSAGNIASFSGQGSVNLNLRPSRAVFDFNGDYNINEGNYQFVVPGLLSKGFSISQGSSVKLGGDIMNTDLDITATYNVRTSLEALLGTSSGTRRNVICALNVTDRLRNPKLDLSIDIPDLDPTTRSQVETALNTPDKIQKQFVSLLLLGSFLPSENSGIINQSNLLFSNVVDIMSGQINNILQRLDIPIDVGFGYQEARSGQNIFDVAVSTQLFENRVIVGGTFGNRKYTAGGASGDFAGDLDIQVKLDPEGMFRFNIFSHSADEFTNYLDYSQRNGVGVSYQKEYNTLGDFFRSIFSPRKKRDQEEGVPEAKPQTVIEIDPAENESGETLPDPDPAGR